MQPTVPQRRQDVPAVAGVLLIVAGAAALVFGQAGLDLFDRLGEQGWPILVIVPGVALLVAAAFVEPPRGLGFAIAGSIVTTVGAILLYQAATDSWASWAYAWLLLPAAAGGAMLVYGLATRERSLVNQGMRMVGIAGAVFIVAAWYFEGLFAGDQPIDLEAWGPVLVIALGVIVVLRAFASAEPPSDEPDPAG